MDSHTPELWRSHALIHSNQISAAEKMDELMFKCWRKGLKRKEILPLAQEICSNTTDEDVSIYFKHMFERELSDKAKYLTERRLQQ